MLVYSRVAGKCQPCRNPLFESGLALFTCFEPMWHFELRPSPAWHHCRQDSTAALFGVPSDLAQTCLCGHTSFRDSCAGARLLGIRRRARGLLAFGRRAGASSARSTLRGQNCRVVPHGRKSADSFAACRSDPDTAVLRDRWISSMRGRDCRELVNSWDPLEARASSAPLPRLFFPGVRDSVREEIARPDCPAEEQSLFRKAVWSDRGRYPASLLGRGSKARGHDLVPNAAFLRAPYVHLRIRRFRNRSARDYSGRPASGDRGEPPLRI